MLTWFHQYHKIFCTTGVHPSRFLLPHQHSLVHYEVLIRLIGAPNGLCMSITESKHIKEVKEPWRWSSKFKVLGQMLLTNQCLDKLVAAAIDFEKCRMLKGLITSSHIQHLCNVDILLMSCHYWTDSTSQVIMELILLMPAKWLSQRATSSMTSMMLCHWCEIGNHSINGQARNSWYVKSLCFITYFDANKSSMKCRQTQHTSSPWAYLGVSSLPPWC